MVLTPHPFILCVSWNPVPGAILGGSVHLARPIPQCNSPTTLLCAGALLDQCRHQSAGEGRLRGRRAREAGAAGRLWIWVAGCCQGRGLNRARVPVVVGELHWGMGRARSLWGCSLTRALVWDISPCVWQALGSVCRALHSEALGGVSLSTALFLGPHRTHAFGVGCGCFSQSHSGQGCWHAAFVFS